MTNNWPRRGQSGHSLFVGNIQSGGCFQDYQQLAFLRRPITPGDDAGAADSDSCCAEARVSLTRPPVGRMSQINLLLCSLSSYIKHENGKFDKYCSDTHRCCECAGTTPTGFHCGDSFAFISLWCNTSRIREVMKCQIWESINCLALSIPTLNSDVQASLT